MASFGDIVEPDSRTAFEDWDETQYQQNGSTLHWTRDLNGGPEIIESLLIFEGQYLYDCIFHQAKGNLELINTVEDVSIHMYRITSYNKYIIVIKDYNLLQSSRIIHLLMHYLTVAHDVMVVQTKPLADFQSPEPINLNCVIRKLCTTKPGAAEDTPYPLLEQPNIITGVAAGALSLREHLGESGIAIICFVEQPEQYQVDEMNTLLKQLNIDPVEASPNNVLNSNLYI